MKKIFSFILFLSFLICSCNCGDITGNMVVGENGAHDGPGGNSGGGNGNGTPGGSGFPKWYLTESEQQNSYIQGPETLFRTTPGKRYRIPAIIVANNGNIVALADDRHSHGSDIGQSANALDVVYKISKDGGKTWVGPKTILPFSKPGNDGIENKGDPLVFKAQNGDLVVLAAAGGAWFAAPQKPSKIAMSRSSDNGENWSAWREVGENGLWDSKVFADGTLRRKAFASAGRGLTLENGRMVAAMLAEYKNGNPALVSIYSDDDGNTWRTGGLVLSSDGNGTYNEPKVIVELNNDDLIMSVRNQSAQRRMYAISKDRGMNWENASGAKEKLSAWSGMKDANVNAEGVRWTSTQLGHDKNRIIHIIADGNPRYGLGLYVSEDEAVTFNLKLKILENTQTAAYSSIDVLGDGTVVTFSEENKNDSAGGAYDLVFRRYNMKAITGEVYKTNWYKPVYERYKFYNDIP